MELGWIQLSSARTNKPRLFDAHRDDAKRFVVRADEILIALVELAWPIRLDAKGDTQIVFSEEN